jgi:hypothetical protein
MVDAEDLVLGPVRGESGLQLSRAGKILAERLLDLEGSDTFRIIVSRTITRAMPFLG